MAKKFLKLLAVVLVVSLVFEVGLFNIKCWQTLGNSPTDVLVSQSREDNNVVYHAQLDNTSANAIAFDFDTSTDAYVDVTVKLSDSGNSADEYDLPQVTYSSSGRKYLMISEYGYIKSLSISVEQPSGAAASIANVTLNPQIPFSFEVKRFVLAFVLLLIIGLLRPRSFLWEIKLGENSRRSRVVSVGALAVALFLALISFAGPTDDMGTNWYWTFAYDEYTQLAHSFAEGKLYLDEEPPSWLTEMDDKSAGESRLLEENNVYDVSQREAQVAQTGEYCKDDAAYYNGHYYVYFGVVPVLALYLPFYLVTGMDMADSFAALFAMLLFIVFAWLLLREMCVQRFPRASLGMFIACFATVLCASGIVITLGRPQFYNIPVVFALMFAALGLYLLAKGWKGKTLARSCVSLFFGALCISCIAGCRPQVLLIGAAILWIGWKIWRRDNGNNRGSKIASLVVPVIAVAAALMAYNAARFGSPFDFGANYNLAGNDMTLRGFSLVRSFEGIVYYLLATPHLTTAFPFFQAFFPESSYMSINMSEPLVMGVLIQCPLTFAIVYFLAKYRKNSLWLPVVYLALSGVIIAVFDANGAGILGRYGQDLGVFFGLGTALVLFEVEGQAGLSDLAKTLVSTLAIVMILFTVTFRLSLMTPDSTPTGPRESTAMMKEAQLLFEFWR